MGRDYETKVAIPSRVNVPSSPSPRPRRRYASSESRSPSPPPKRYHRRSPSPDRRRERRRSRSPRSPRNRAPVRERSPPPRPRTPPAPARIEPPPRRRAVDAVERTRNRRLFGTVLNTLSKFQSELENPKVKAGNARRRELEAKAREKVKRGVLDENRAAKRQVGPEWRAWELSCMEKKHTDMRLFAKFLKTKTEPSLYFIPWKLTKANQAQLDKQAVEVEEIIAKERDQLAKKHQEQEALEKGSSLPNSRQTEDAAQADRDHTPLSGNRDGINNEDIDMNLDIADDDRNDESVHSPGQEESKATAVEQVQEYANGSGDAESKHSGLDSDDDQLQDAPQHTTTATTGDDENEQHEHSETAEIEMAEEGSESSEPHQQSPQSPKAEKDNDAEEDADMIE